MPGSVCSVALCKSNAIISKKLGDQVRFFTFPKDIKLRKEWVRRCFRPDKFNPINKRICSKHFKLSDYEDAMEAKIQNRLPKILKRNCVPSLNLKPEKNPGVKKARLERAAKKKQKEFLKQILENEEMEEELPERNVSNTGFSTLNLTNDDENYDEDGVSLNNQVIVTIKHDIGERQPSYYSESKEVITPKPTSDHIELEKKISDFISSKVQIVVAELLYEET